MPDNDPELPIWPDSASAEDDEPADDTAPPGKCKWRFESGVWVAKACSCESGTHPVAPTGGKPSQNDVTLTDCA